jgi:hypothetical protein
VTKHQKMDSIFIWLPLVYTTNDQLNLTFVIFPFDNDMKKAHLGTKLCIYHEKTVSVYQRNTIFTVYFKKSGN